MRKLSTPPEGDVFIRTNISRRFALLRFFKLKNQSAPFEDVFCYIPLNYQQIRKISVTKPV